MFSTFFGSAPSKRAEPQKLGSRGWFSSSSAPQPGGPVLTKQEVKRLNRHWGKRINKRDLSYQEFLNLPDWQMNPLVPRTLEVVNDEVRVWRTTGKNPKNAKNNAPVLHFQDYVAVFTKLRFQQLREQKVDFLIDKLMDFDGDGVVSEADLTYFFLLVTGLSDDAARYHAARCFANFANGGGDGGEPVDMTTRPYLTKEEVLALLPVTQLCARFDLAFPP
mmetsp:Transcript_90/g.182  ORF Transcript_90/g.182 Transcript_90/m.182 type:complete len:220 (-) Transcript_90:343-1002(-)